MFPVKKFPAVKREEKRVRYECFSAFGKSGAGERRGGIADGERAGESLSV